MSLTDFRGRKVVLAFHPLAFTPVCANEMCELEKNWARLQSADTAVLSISVDSTAVKAAWAQALGGVSYDMLADFYPHGAVAAQYGVLSPFGFCERSVFLLDRDGVIRYARQYEMPQDVDLGELLKEVDKL